MRRVCRSKDQRKPIVLVISDQKRPLGRWEPKDSYFVLLASSSLARRLVTPKSECRRKPRGKAANFPYRRISRHAQIDLVFASSQQQSQLACSVCQKFTRRGEWWAKAFGV